MHQSLETPAPRVSGHSGGLTRPKPGFNALLTARRPRGAVHLTKCLYTGAMEWWFNSTCNHPPSRDNSRNLTRRTEGRTIRKVMGGMENCANPKDNHGIKFIKNQCAINSHPSLHDSFAIKQAHTVFWKPWHHDRIYSTTDKNNVTIATTALKSNSWNSQIYEFMI